MVRISLNTAETDKYCPELSDGITPKIKNLNIKSFNASFRFSVSLVMRWTKKK
jgi:hypothetical protein